MDYLADTVAIIKHLRQKLPRPSQVASIFQQTDRGQHLVYISAITLMEIMYLSEARRIDLSLADLIEHITQSSNYQIADVNSSIVQSAAEIIDVPELHDRIIAGTARWLGVPVLTSDAVLGQSHYVQTIW
jgi:predicted nucleic acid-binding protein